MTKDEKQQKDGDANNDKMATSNRKGVEMAC
jgi:hypothetical protein